MRLNDICDYVSSRTTDSGNYISTENMLPNKGGVTESSVIPTGAVVEYKVGDVLISNIRPYFQKIWYADCDGGCSPDVLCIRAKENTYSKYLYYLLSQQAFFDFMMSGAKGCKMPRGDKKQIMQWEVTLPPIEEQKRIAGILSALDDKIELNRRINANLELQAQTLFNHWFVENKSENEIQGTASDFYDITIGKTPPRKEPQWFTTNNRDMIWVSISDMGNSGMYIADSSEYLTKDAVDKFNIVVVPDNTVILSFKLTIGRVAITNGVQTTNEAIAHFKTDNESLIEYTYLYLKNYNYASLGSTSSIAMAINSKIIKSMPFIMPDEKTLSKFHNITKPLFDTIKNNLTENKRLAQLRDTLLPKLMNG